MAVRIEVEKSGSNVVLHAPEHPQLAGRATALGGKAKGGAWTFAAAKEDQVRALTRELWGTDGRGKDPAATLRVELSLYGEGPVGRQGEAWICGRLLARRRRFDAPVEMGPDVKLVSGAFSTWGGSPGRPALGARYGTVVDVLGVPKPAAAAAEKEFPLEVKMVEAPDTVVGAWSRTVTERIPGPRARAEEKLSGKPAKAAKPEAPKAAAPPAPAPKPAAKPAPAPKAAAPAPAAKPAVAVKASVKKATKSAKVAAKAAQKVAKKAAKKAAKAVRKAAAVVAKTVKKAAPKKATKKAAPKPVQKAAPKKVAKKAAPKKATKKAAPKPVKKAAPKMVAKKAAPKKATKKAAPKPVKKAAPKKVAKKAAPKKATKKARKPGKR